MWHTQRSILIVKLIRPQASWDPGKHGRNFPPCSFSASFVGGSPSSPRLLWHLFSIHKGFPSNPHLVTLISFCKLTTPKFVSLAWTLLWIPDSVYPTACFPIIARISNRHLKTEFLTFSPQKSCHSPPPKKSMLCPNSWKGWKWPYLEKGCLQIWLRIWSWVHPRLFGWVLKPKKNLSTCLTSHYPHSHPVEHHWSLVFCDEDGLGRKETKKSHTHTHAHTPLISIPLDLRCNFRICHGLLIWK